MAKKRKVQSESPALVGPSQNRSAEHIEIPASRWDEYTYDKAPSVRCSSGTPSRPVFRGDADPYFPPNANAAITTFSGEMDFRLKFLCQADPIEADSLYKEAVQGLVNITLPPNILNQLCQDTILSQMQELGAQQYKIDRVSELIRREVVYKTSWLLANEMNTMEKVELGLATVIAATSRLHANKFDHEVLGEIIKGFQGLQNHLSGLQTSNFTSGASIQMPATEQCSRRQSAAVPNLPVNTEIKIEGEPIPLSEVCHKTEGQEHPYDDGSPRNKSHKPEIDTEQVNIKQEILTQSSGNIKSPPLTTVAWPDSPRGSRDRCHFSNSEDEYGSVNEEAMVDVLERTVGEPRAQSSATAFGEDSESESDDVGKTAMRKRRMLMQSLKRSPTPCIDLLYGTDPLSPMHTEIAVQKIMDEIDRRFGSSLPNLDRRSKRGRLSPFTLKQISDALRNQMNRQNPEKARLSIERVLQPLIGMNTRHFEELGTCSFLILYMMQDITPVLDLLLPNCPECCPDNELFIVDHIIYAIHARENRTGSDEAVIDLNNYNFSMTNGMRKTLSGAFKASRGPDCTRWLLESKLRMLVFGNRSRFPEIEQSLLGRAWTAVSGSKW